MSIADDKKFVGMEAVLQAINKSYITLPEAQIKRNNLIMKQVFNPTFLTRNCE